MRPGPARRAAGRASPAPSTVRPCAAVKWTANGVGWTGRRVVFEGIDVFDLDDPAKVRTLWSYWDPAILRAQLRSG